MKKMIKCCSVLLIIAMLLSACSSGSPDNAAQSAASATETMIPSDAPVGADELSGSWFFEIIVNTVGDKGKGIFSSSGKPKNTDFVIAINLDGTGTVTMDRIAYQASYQKGKLRFQGPAFSGKTPYANIDVSMEGTVIRSYMKLTLKGTVRFFDSATNDEYASGVWDADKLEE